MALTEGEWRYLAELKREIEQAQANEKAARADLSAALEELKRQSRLVAEMRPIVEAVALPLAEVRKAVCRCTSPYDGPHHPNCIVARARMFVSKNPVPSADGT